jgi:hypothetical protein
MAFKISSAGSEAATNEAGNKIVTVADKTHVTWQEVTEDGYFNRVRTLDTNSGEWSPTYDLGKAYDNHARAVITADSGGYLHLILSGHSTPCDYRRSVRSNDASEWTSPVEVASGTYPYLVCDSDDTLYLTMRDAVRWGGVDLYVKSAGRKWEASGKIIKRKEEYVGYAAFASGMGFDRKGVLHLVNDFYEGYGIYENRGIHQAVAYMQSPDGGRTWRTMRGDPIETPARPHQMDVIAESTGLRHEPMPPPVMVAQGNIAVDSEGKPHVLYLYHLNEPGQLILASPDEEGIWRQRPIDAVKEAFPNFRPSACRGTFTIDREGVFRALVTVAPLDNPDWSRVLPSRGRTAALRNGIPVVWLVSEDGGESFRAEAAFDPGSDTTVQSPKIELPVGHGTPSPGAPGVLWFNNAARELPRYKRDWEKNSCRQGLQNDVYWQS